MPNFAYVAKTHTGEEQSGVMSGASVDQVVDDLHRRGLIVLHVAEDAIFRGRAVGWKERIDRPVLSGGVSTRDLALFTRQLSTLFEAGIPLVRGLRGLSKDESNRTLSRTVARVAETVEEGNSLADALAEHPRIFNGLYVSMVRAGEGAGTLDKILGELAVYLEKLDAIKTKVRSAMSYPVFVLVFAIAISLFLLLKIVPTFEEIYADFGQQLPGPTRAVVQSVISSATTRSLRSGSRSLVFLAFWLWSKTAAGRYMKDSFLLERAGLRPHHPQGHHLADEPHAGHPPPERPSRAGRAGAHQGGDRQRGALARHRPGEGPGGQGRGADQRLPRHRAHAGDGAPAHGHR